MQYAKVAVPAGRVTSTIGPLRLVICNITNPGGYNEPNDTNVSKILERKGRIVKRNEEREPYL